MSSQLKNPKKMLKKAPIAPARPMACQGPPLPEVRSRLEKILNVSAGSGLGWVNRDEARLGALGVGG